MPNCAQLEGIKLEIKFKNIFIFAFDTTLLSFQLFKCVEGFGLATHEYICCIKSGKMSV